jgi:hypothetical protein
VQQNVARLATLFRQVSDDHARRQADLHTDLGSSGATRAAGAWDQGGDRSGT